MESFDSLAPNSLGIIDSEATAESQGSAWVSLVNLNQNPLPKEAAENRRSYAAVHAAFSRHSSEIGTTTSYLGSPKRITICA